MKRSKEILLAEAVRFVESRPIEHLVEAAASIANSLQAGAGAFIENSLMEKNLRDALGLEKGQLVQINAPEIRRG